MQLFVPYKQPRGSPCSHREATAVVDLRADNQYLRIMDCGQCGVYAVKQEQPKGDVAVVGITPDLGIIVESVDLHLRLNQQKRR